MEMKKCTKCGIEKHLSKFYIMKTTKDGISKRCLECKENAILKSKLKSKERSRGIYLNNREELCLKRKEYSKSNRKQIIEYQREYYAKRRKESIVFNLSQRVSVKFNKCFKKFGINRKEGTFDTLGCTKQEFLEHLNNNPYGFKYSKDFDLCNIIKIKKGMLDDDVYKLNHYTNIKLIPKDYNISYLRYNEFDIEHFENWLKQQNLKSKD